jgi:hypothetical protein
MPPLPLVPLAVAGAVAGFLGGRVFGQPEAGGGPAIAGGEGAPAADSSLAGTAGDVWDSWGTASLNFAGSEGAGELAGVVPIPPAPYVQPPPAPAPAPAPSGSTAPLCWPTGPARPTGSNRWFTVDSNHFRLFTYSGGKMYPGAYYSLHFSAWAGANVYVAVSTGGKATFAKILTGGHAGKYVHTSDPGLAWHVCPAGTR